MKKLLLISGNKSTFFVLLLFIFTVPEVCFTQVKFSAVCQDRQIGRYDYLKVQYIVENASNVEQIAPPAFKNFSVVSGPNQQSSTSIVNGTVNQSVAIEFILKPTATGTFTLPPGKAKVNGKTLLSNSLSVQVTNKSTGNAGGTAISPFSNIITDVFPMPPIHQYDDYILRKGENVAAKIQKNLFVKLDVNKTSCYIGEPVVATYKLYTRLKSESNLTKTPSFNGFSVNEMKVPDSYATATEKYNGREYSVYILRKVQLYALQPGIVELGPVEVENQVTFIKAAYANSKNGDIFFDMMRDFVDATTPSEGVERQKVTLQSKPLSINVKPLPELNQPKDFKGAVGSFVITASVEKNSITTDEAGNLTVSISGSGNMPMVNAPAFDWPDGLEGFDPKITENIDNNLVPLKGQKVFTYPFTISAPGKYVIRGIPFSFFDITTHTYKTLVTPPLAIEVKKGKEIKPVLSNQLTGDKNKEDNGRSTHLNWFRVLSVAGFLIAAFVIWSSRRSGRTAKVTSSPLKEEPDQGGPKPMEEPAPSVPQNPLEDAEKRLSDNNSSDFYYTLNNCLKNYLSAKLQYPAKELTKKKINELLDNKNVGVGTTLMLSSLLENIELNLYAPLSSANQMQQVYENASEVVALLDKQIS